MYICSCDTSNVDLYLDNTIHLLSMITKDESYSALDFYLKNYEQVASKTKIESDILRKVLWFEKLEHSVLHLNDDLKKRSSGVALIFFCSQLAKADIEFFIELNKLKYLSPSLKKHLAYAWGLNPQCRCLNDKTFRQHFVSWISTDNNAIAICLLAEIQRNDSLPELITDLSLKWIKKGLNSNNLLEYLLKASEFDQLRNTCKEIIRRCGYFFFNNEKALQTLIQCAFKIEDYRSVVVYSEFLLHTDITDDVRKSVLAQRLVALVDMDKEQEAIYEYSNLWMKKNWEFPFPDKLLFTFQIHGRVDLENHLLKKCVIRKNLPTWLKLRRQSINNTSIDTDLLKAWSGLYSTDNSDIRILFGFSVFLTSLPRTYCYDQVQVIRQHWDALHEYESYMELAGSFLVLLSDSKEEVIENFKKYLLDKEILHPMAKRATWEYIRALAFRKQWDALRQYMTEQEKKSVHLIRAVSPFEEYEFIKIMASLEQLPNTENCFVQWCRYWERLISLPLDTEMIVQMLDHFVNLKEKIFAEKVFAVNSHLFDDVSLQILRRSKAEAERIFIHVPSEKDRNNKYAYLRTAGLGEMHEVLRELMAYQR